MKRWILLLLFVEIGFCQPTPDTLWTSLVEDPNWSALYVEAMDVNADRAIFMCGYQAFGDIFLPRLLAVKYNANGERHGFYLSSPDVGELGTGIRATADGGCIVSGIRFHNDNPSTDYELVKLSEGMEVEWSRAFNLDFDTMPFLADAADGWYLVGGRILDASGLGQSRIVRIASNGDSLWTRDLTQDGWSENPVTVRAQGGDLWVCTQAQSAGGSSRVGLYRIAADGTPRWSRVYETEYDIARDFALTDEDEVTMLVQQIGSQDVEMALMHINSGGVQVSREILALPADSGFSPYQFMSMVHGDRNTVTLGGTHLRDGIQQNICLMKANLAADTIWTREYASASEFGGGIGRVLLSYDAGGSYILAANIGFPNWSNSTYVIKTGPDDVGVLQGVVRHADDQSPFAGIIVRTANDSAQTVTDQQGRYQLSLRSGNYAIVYEGLGACSQRLENIVIENHSTVEQNMELQRVWASFDVTSLNFLWSGEEIFLPFTLENNSTVCPLTYACVDTSWWLIVTPTEGSVAPGQTLELRARIQGWLPNPPSEYQSEIRVHHNGQSGVFIIPVTVFVTVDADKQPTLPTVTELSGIYPNPFNPQTTVEFELSTAEQVRLVVYDLTGREVAVLEDGWLGAGTYRRYFDGGALAAGVYFAKFSAGEKVELRKMVLLK